MIIFSEVFCCLGERGTDDVRCMCICVLPISLGKLLYASVGLSCTASKPGRGESLSSCGTCGIQKCSPICASPLLLPCP